MLMYFVVLLFIILIDGIAILKRKNKKDILVFSILSLFAIGFGVFYYSNEYKVSLIENLFKLFNMKV